MGRKDEYYNRAKQEGYRARSAYKLKQLDERADLFAPGDTVVDLGAAPGGWLQVAAEAVGEQGTVVGVDRQRIDPLDGVETIRGDLTESGTHDRVRAAVGAADVVLSDLAPEMSGEYSVDQARSVHLARQAVTAAESLLVAGGHLVVKVFEGRDVQELRADLDAEFDTVHAVHPEASRDASSELYLVAKGRLTAPVDEGEVVTVDIVDEGADGDGVAKIEGYTVFVPGATAGETVTVEIEAVKPRYGFASRRSE